MQACRTSARAAVLLGLRSELAWTDGAAMGLTSGQHAVCAAPSGSVSHVPQLPACMERQLCSSELGQAAVVLGHAQDAAAAQLDLLRKELHKQYP